MLIKFIRFFSLLSIYFSNLSFQLTIYLFFTRTVAKCALRERFEKFAFVGGSLENWMNYVEEVTMIGDESFKNTLQQFQLKCVTNHLTYSKLQL